MGGTRKKWLPAALTGLFFLSVFFSCSMQAERKSFTASLDQIDALIRQRQYKDAVAGLEKAEKSAYSPLTCLSIFKRYMQLGETVRAGKTLALALKKNPENPELCAVYSNFLLRRGRTAEALAAGESLRGTKYGSVYSEALFTDALSSENGAAPQGGGAEKSASDGADAGASSGRNPAGGRAAALDSEKYYSAYYDAYTGSKNHAWLRNCAVLELRGGNFEKAARLRPEEVYAADDSFFWALVMYDAGRYGDAAAFAEIADELYPDSEKAVKKKLSPAEIALLKSDAFVSLSEPERAEDSRKKFFASYPLSAGAESSAGGAGRTADGAAGIFAADTEGGGAAQSAFINGGLPVMFLNSALWAESQGDDHECLRLLSYAVSSWPDHVPSLAAYADFAYRSSAAREESAGQLSLRDAGLATLEMERYDSRAKVPVSDAAHRIEESLGRTHDPLLYVVQLDLNYKTDRTLSDTEKCAGIWRLLEQSAAASGSYPPELVRYAVHFFLSKKRTDDARLLYTKYMAAGYGIAGGADFYDRLIAELVRIEPPDVEIAAYFAALDALADEALRLYEACVLEGGGESGALSVSPRASDSACVNLAMINRSLGRKRQASELYSRTAGRAADVRLKSTAVYRLALIFYEDGDLKNARRSAEYAVALNPKNAEARLLVSKITGQ